jgi:hypothetical protein
MNVLWRAMLLTAMSSTAVFCQGGPSQDAQQLPRVGDIAVVSSTSDSIEPFAFRTYKSGSSTPLSLLRLNYWSATRATSATSGTVTPFSYTIARDGFDYFPLGLGPMRYTFWPRTSQFNRPAGGRLQSLIDGVLRHYTSHPVVPVNERCLRWLSCNSLYEQALRRRAVPSTTR